MNSKTLWTLIRIFMGKRAVLYFGAIIMKGVFGSLFQILFSITIGDLCSMAQKGSMNGMGELLTRNMTLVAFVMICDLLGGVIYGDEAKRAAKEINNAVYAKALLLPVSFYDAHHSGEFMSKIMFDAGRTGDIFGSRLRRILMPVLTVIICIVPMFYLCPPVMAGLFFMSLLSLAIHFVMIRPMKKAGVMAADANQEMTKNISNILQGIEIIKMYPVRRKVLDTYDEANQQLEAANKKQADYAALLNGLNTAFDLIGSFCFLALGIWYIAKCNGQVGSLVSLYLLYGTFNWNFLQIGLYVPDLANCLVNADRILEFLELEEEAVCWMEQRKEYADVRFGDAAMEVRDLTFGYEGAKENVINHYSAAFQKGACVAVVGKSGRGKSTLAKLLLGFYQPQEGTIYLNGIPVKRMTMKQLREQIAYVPQEPYLYNISIAENIRYGKPDASAHEIEQAAKATHAHDFIMKLANGYETIVGERGAKLSGGEKQRIAIARAVLRNAPILIMDEATSALDNESEVLIQDAIQKLKGSQTIIMIAHRPSTIAMADYVVEM